MTTGSRIKNSEALFQQAKSYIPGGAQLSRRPELFVPGAYPLYIEKTKGCRFTDVDGNEYIDYLSAYGPIILGYAYPRVNDAVRAMLDKATVVTMSHPIHLELARELVRLIPCAEMVCFKKTGSGATSTAVKIARVYTGREKVIRYGYSGWHDWCSDCPWWQDYTSGAPEVLRDYIFDIQYNDLESLEKLLKEKAQEVACLIMEPVKLEIPGKGYLKGVRDLCGKYGILLIFDEIKTGFRLALGGAQEYFGITPDMATYSKGMANGFPISAVVGRKDVLRVAERIALSATFDGEVLSMAAALATIHEIEEKNVNEHLWRMGQRLMDGLDNLAAETGVQAKCVGLPPMPYLNFTSEDETENQIAKESFYREAVTRGVFFAPNHLWFISFSHKESDIDQTLEVSREAFKTAKEKLSSPEARRSAQLRSSTSRFPSQAKEQI